MKRFLSLLAFLPGMLLAQGQETASSTASDKGFWSDVQVSASAGSPGLGLDIKKPLVPNLSLRVGFSYMPRVTHVSDFDMAAVQGTSTEEQEKRVKRLAKYLGDFIGNDKVDDVIDMQLEVEYFNAKVLFDWTPFRNKRWRITAGAYVGNSKFAKACNTLEEGPTTTAMRLYNKMYDQIANLDEWEYPTISVGGISIEMDPVQGEKVKQKFKEYGRAAVQIGKLADGSPVYLQPDEDALLRAKGRVHNVKPYIGFGYDSQLDKERRWTLGFDAGVMYWGMPHLTTKYIVEKTVTGDDGETSSVMDLEDICLVHDVKGIRGKVGSYVRLAKNLSFYPVVELRLAYRLGKR